MANRAKKIKDHHWTEAQVFKALEAHYCGADKWVLVPQIPDATSWNKVRTCDAMAFHCWRSEGIAVHGFEIKVSRADWLHELQKPEKSIGFVKRCHYWWIATPVGIVDLQELPATWGLREVWRNEDGTFASKVRRPATWNAEASWDVHFIVALARVCYRKSPDRIADAADLKAEFDRGYELGVQQTENRLHQQSGSANVLNELNELKKSVAEFEQNSGLDLQWRPGDIGKAVQLFREFQKEWGGLESIFSGIENLSDAADGLAQIVGFSRKVRKGGRK